LLHFLERRFLALWTRTAGAALARRAARSVTLLGMSSALNGAVAKPAAAICRAPRRAPHALFLKCTLYAFAWRRIAAAAGGRISFWGRWLSLWRGCALRFAQPLPVAYLQNNEHRRKATGRANLNGWCRCYGDGRAVSAWRHA